VLLNSVDSNINNKGSGVIMSHKVADCIIANTENDSSYNVPLNTVLLTVIVLITII